METSQISKELKNSIPDLIGNLEFNFLSNVITISGNVYTNNPEKLSNEIKRIIKENYPKNVMVASTLKVNEFVVSTNDELCTNQTKEKVLDEVNILYHGFFPTSLIKTETKFRHPTITMTNVMNTLDKCVKVLNFISPIILDKNLNIIDGNRRLKLALDNNIKKVLVVILDIDDKRADFLRLALNRTSEYQRWNFQNIDDYVDNTPQAQPLLEPLGFFGKKLLPTSFFTNTVIDYVIDPFNTKQREYKQEDGLAEWAKIRREEMLIEAEKRRSKKEKIFNSNTVSLFDLSPKDEDFIETNNFEENFESYAEKWVEKAEEITKSYDKVRKEYFEKTGKPWQEAHRTSKDVAIENRNKAIEFIQEHSELSENEKEFILENLDEFADDLIGNDDSIEVIKEKIKAKVQILFKMGFLTYK